MEKVKISKLDNFGRGISSINDKICFVPNALPNEEVEIEITNNKKNYQEGIVSNYISKSEDRIESICPYYPSCGGCSLMHYNYSKQLEFKETKIKELLEKIANLKDIKINKGQLTKAEGGNLIPFGSEAQAREKGRNGGIASGIARRKKKTMEQWAQCFSLGQILSILKENKEKTLLFSCKML